MAGFNTKPTVKPKDTKGALLRILSYLGAFKFFIVIILILCVVSNLLSLVGPSLAGAAISEAAAGKGNVNFDKVNYYVLRMLIFYLTSSLLSIVINFLMIYVSKHVGKRMRNDVFEKLLRLPVGYFDRNATGDIISRVSYDIDVVTTCIATDLVSIMTSMVTIVGSLIMMIKISPWLSLVQVVTIPLAVVYTAKMRKITQPRFLARSKNYGALNGFVEEMLTGQKTILAYSYEKKVSEQFEDKNSGAANAYYDAEYYAATMGPTVNGINNLSLGLVGMFGAMLYMFKYISLGNISSFILYSRKFSGPINEIANVISEIYSALSASERVFKLLDEPEEVADVEGAILLDNVKGDVTLDHVVFGYEEGKTIIHDLSFEALAGKTVAIVGPTGAGKTTIINLLMRFYDVNAGQVCVDGPNIIQYTRESLRGAYAMVLQDTWVFKGTIYENIAYGKEGATMEEVVVAAKAAHIHNFVMQLPQGYNTVISEDGTNISKGQKQLLTIARAMLYDCKMLILDEATSNVDTSTEREVQVAMRKLMEGKTCFVIAHRLSTIENADLILVLKAGDVVEQGTHDELMKRGGFYKELYYSQYE